MILATDLAQRSEGLEELSAMSTPWTPTSVLAQAVYAAGFLYHPDQDIIYSRMDALQRNFGYAFGYDAAALAMNAVIDCEPIFFDYDGQHWMMTHCVTRTLPRHRRRSDRGAKRIRSRLHLDDTSSLHRSDPEGSLMVYLWTPMVTWGAIRLVRALIDWRARIRYEEVRAASVASILRSVPADLRVREFPREAGLAMTVISGPHNGGDQHPGPALLQEYLDCSAGRGESD
jgi:hypothetical protein